MKPLLILLLLTAGPLTALAQDDSAKPDRWRNLILNESTADDAIQVLGKPSKDSIGQLPTAPLSNWITKRQKEKIFRTLEFNKPEGINKAWLFFLNGKLVEI